MYSSQAFESSASQQKKMGSLNSAVYANQIWNSENMGLRSADKFQDYMKTINHSRKKSKGLLKKRIKSLSEKEAQSHNKPVKFKNSILP